MDKVKIQEIADESGLSNGELLDKAKELGFDVRAANSTIRMQEAGVLIDYAISGTLPKGFKKPGEKSNIKVVKKKVVVPSANVPHTTRGLGEILGDVEEAYEKDLVNVKNTNLYNELKIFFDEVYSKRIHISCLELPILKILLTKDDWFSRDELLKELKIYGQFNRGYLSLDHLWSQRFGKGKEAFLLNKIVEHDATVTGKKKSKYRIKENVHTVLNELVKEYNIEDVKSLIEERLDYASKKGKAKIPTKINIDSKNEERKRKFTTESKGITYTFLYKNILLKGVPGTGKSRTLKKIIDDQLNLKEHYDTNVLRINIHAASSNADLMQGIGISSNNDGHIEYKEKQGLILELIERA
ncbi:translation initiation factor IF-2 N-terminal domain-containing protein, partial [Sulfurovum sp.]|uniref:translation initiation factor IF-2 N-terminal domain-containing protein n=1 Tax=Sulfurovum sp. TaxID=1969726 RepID=UPI003563B3B5